MPVLVFNLKVSQVFNLQDKHNASLIPKFYGRDIVGHFRESSVSQPPAKLLLFVFRANTPAEI